MTIEKPFFLNNSHTDSLSLAIEARQWKIVAQLLWEKVNQGEKINPNKIYDKTTLVSHIFKNKGVDYDNHKYFDWVLDFLSDPNNVSEPINLWIGNPRPVFLFFSKIYFREHEKKWVQTFNQQIFNNTKFFEQIKTLNFEFHFPFDYQEEQYSKKDKDPKENKKYSFVEFLVENSYLEELEKMKSLGYDFNETNKDNRSLLFFCKNDKTFNFLKQFNYSFDHVDNYKRTAIQYFMNESRSIHFQKTIAQYLKKEIIQKNIGNIELIQQEQLVSLKTILSYHRNKSKNIEGNKATEFQSLRKDFFGSNINFSDLEGNTLLSAAIFTHHWKVVVDLTRANCSWLAENKLKLNPLFYYFWHQENTLDTKLNEQRREIEKHIWQEYGEKYAEIDENILSHVDEKILNNQLTKSSYYFMLYKKICTNMLEISKHYPDHFDIKEIYQKKLEIISNHLHLLTSQIIDKVYQEKDSTILEKNFHYNDNILALFTETLNFNKEPGNLIYQYLNDQTKQMLMETYFYSLMILNQKKLFDSHTTTNEMYIHNSNLKKLITDFLSKNDSSKISAHLKKSLGLYYINDSISLLNEHKAFMEKIILQEKQKDNQNIPSEIKKKTFLL